MSTPLHTWDDKIREELSRQVIRNGWMRNLPHAGTALLMSVVMDEQPSTMDQLSEALRSPHSPGGDWGAPCWDPVEYFTDEQLVDLHAEYGDDDDRSAAEVNAGLDAHQAALVEQVDRYAAHHGLGPVRTCQDALELLVSVGVVHRGDDGRIYPVYPMPDPQDVLPVSDEELATLATMRERDRAEDAGRALHDRLEADLKQVGEVFTSVDRLAGVTGMDEETIRLGLVELVDVGLVRIVRGQPLADIDPAAVGLHARFRIISE